MFETAAVALASRTDDAAGVQTLPVVAAAVALAGDTHRVVGVGETASSAVALEKHQAAVGE